MTEIPEHLLRKSRERRAALSGEAPAADAAEGDAVVAASAPAPAAAAATRVPAEVVAPEPPKPVAPYVAAAMARKKIPLWVVPVLVAIPLWAWAYVFTLQSPQESNAVLSLGAEIYTGASPACSGCHGAAGGGGTGYELAGGEVALTFPGPTGIATQMDWVVLGTSNWPDATVGDPARAGGPHVTGSLGVMPGFGTTLTVMELAGVVLHERTAWHTGEQVDADIALSDALLELEESGELMFMGEAVTFETAVPEGATRADYQAMIDQAAELLGAEG